MIFNPAPEILRYSGKILRRAVSPLPDAFPAPFQCLYRIAPIQSVPKCGSKILKFSANQLAFPPVLFYILGVRLYIFNDEGYHDF